MPDALSGGPSHRRGPRTILAVLLVVVVLVSGGLAYLHVRGGLGTAHPPIPNRLTIQLDKLGLSCPTGLAWSPDGASLAVTFQENTCQESSGGAERTSAGIFDARSGALRAVLDLQDTLKSQGVNDTYVGAFTWSPDGKSLDFLAGYNPNYAGPTRSGIFVAPVDGKPGHLLVGPSHNPSQHLTLPFGISSQIWSLRDARQVTNITSAPAPALSYRWTAGPNAVNITAGAQNSPPGAFTYSGSPVAAPSSATFSFWQPGTYMPILAVNSDGSPALDSPPATWVYLAAPTLLSPDGNFVAFSYPLVARVAPASGPASATPDARICASLFIQIACSMAPLSPPDEAFAQVQTGAEAGVKVTNSNGTATGMTQYNPVTVAWRPDGTYLATILPSNIIGDGTGNITVTISILATTSGATQKKLAVQIPSTGGSFANPGVPPFAWSPSGKQLAFSDFGTNTLVIWGGSSLPA